MKSSVSGEPIIRSATTTALGGTALEGTAMGDRIPNGPVGPDFAQNKSLQIWLWMGLVLPLLSMLPLLSEQAKGIFAQRIYLFFPLTTLIGAWLFYRTGNYRLASLRRGRIALGVACFGMGLAVLGIYFFSPWVVHVAAVVVIFGWSLGAFGGSSWTRIAAICSLFAVSVPVPSGRDLQIDVKLHALASWAANGFLDAISVPNIVEGNTLQIQDRKILVGEVCGGSDSVYALMAFGLAIVVSRRCSLLVSLVTLLLVPFCSVLGNVLRILATAIGLEYLDVNLSTGNGYLITAVIVFVLSMASIVLLHISAQAILDPISEKTAPNNLTKLFQWVTDWPRADDRSLLVPTLWRVKFVALVLPCLACVIFGSLSAYAVLSTERVNTSLFGFSDEQASVLPAQGAFPAQFGSLRMIGYTPTTQSSINTLGRFSHLWKFENNGNQVFATLDFPFNGWRAVWVGYQSSGWKIIDTKPVNIPPERGGEAWTVEEFRMQNQYGLFGFVWYAFFDDEAVPIRRENEAVGYHRVSLLKRLQKSPVEKLPMSFQVQLFLESGRDLSELEMESNRQLFFEVFERIRQQSETVLKKAK